MDQQSVPGSDFGPVCRWLDCRAMTSWLLTLIIWSDWWMVELLMTLVTIAILGGGLCMIFFKKWFYDILRKDMEDSLNSMARKRLIIMFPVKTQWIWISQVQTCPPRTSWHLGHCFTWVFVQIWWPRATDSSQSRLFWCDLGALGIGVRSSLHSLQGQ